MDNKYKIAVICGGLSNEREVSIKSGRQVFDNLNNERFEKDMIEISKNGRWLLTEKQHQKEIGVSKSLTIMNPEEGFIKNDLKCYDIVFLALHGKYGEDGKIQSILDILGIPYTGSGVLASALGMNKAKATDFARSINIDIPRYILLTNKELDLTTIDRQINASIKYPCVVKPNESGSSIGISIVKSLDELGPAISNAFKEDERVILQEYITGREITCGVLGNSGSGELHALPPVEIVSANVFFDYNAKYLSNQTKEICPAQISDEEAETVMALAKSIHFELGCDGLTRSDFILSEGKFYFLEINTLPGLTEQSLCPKEAIASGMSFSEFLEKQIELAIKKYHAKKNFFIS